MKRINNRTSGPPPLKITEAGLAEARETWKDKPEMLAVYETATIVSQEEYDRHMDSMGSKHASR